MSHRLATLWLRNDVLFKLFGGKCKQKIDDCLRVLHNFSNSIILKRREELLKNGDASEQFESTTTAESGDSDAQKRMALLDILLQSAIDGQPLSNADIREEVDTFMFEVYYTVTTSSITFKTDNSYFNIIYVV